MDKQEAYLTLAKIAKIVRAKDITKGTDLSQKIYKFFIDSRLCKEKSCFIPLKGEKNDGHLYIEDALKRGASAYLTQYKVFKKKKINFANGLVVKDTYQALCDIASYNFKKHVKQSIAITGSYGKTTTKFLAGAILKRLNIPHYVPEGNLNGKYGTPLALANLLYDTDIAVLEYATSSFGEIKIQLNVASPDVRVLLGVSAAHTEFLRNLEGVIKAKGEIFEGGNKHVLPLDLYEGYYSYLNGKVLTFGYTPSSHMQILETTLTEEGTKVVLRFTPENRTFRTVLKFYNERIGENLSAVALAFYLLGIDLEKTIKAASSFTPPEGRGNLEHYTFAQKRITVINESYNANPGSLKNALSTFAKIPTRKDVVKIAVVGKMAELGDLEDRYHEEVAKFADQLDIDVLIFYGQPQYQISERGQYTDTVDEAKELVKKIIREKDSEEFLLMAKASNSQQAWRVWEDFTPV